MGTNAYDDEFDFDDDQNDSGQNEPNWVKELRKQNKELAKQNKALSEELGKFKTQARTSTLAELLQAKGVNPKAAKFYPSDLEVNEENLAKWLTEEGDAFAPAEPPKEAEQSAEDETQTGEEEQQEAPPWMAQFERIQRNEVAGQTLAPKSNEQAAQSLQSAAANAKNSQEFLAWLQRGGAGA